MTAAAIHVWPTPATNYPRVSLGRASIRTHYCERGVHASLGRLFQVHARLPVTNLCIDGAVWMVDDPGHWERIQQDAATMHGSVLCAGLGLGLIVHALHANPAVRAITVVERERDVIDLITPLVPSEKLTIVHGDWWTFDSGGQEPDVVFFDLLVGNSFGLAKQARAAQEWCSLMYPHAEIINFGFTETVAQR